MTEEENRDPLGEIIANLHGDPKFEELREALMNNYVYMACFSKDPLVMAYNEGMREIAAMLCGVNEEVKQWLEKTRTPSG